MIRFFLRSCRVWAASALLLTWCAWVAAAPEEERLLLQEPLWLAQTATIAVCGQSLCNCGTARLISDQAAPCEAASLTGSCRTGSGHCCICEVRRTVAVCADALCECSNSRLLAQTAAPCTVTSTAGTCHVASGHCCICALD